MNTDWFIYSFVARGAVILAEHTTQGSNLSGIAAQWLKTLTQPAHRKFTMSYDHNVVNFLTDDEYVYGVVAKESVGAQILFAFLERVKDDFKKIYGHGKGDAASEKSLSKSFGPVMKEHMLYVVNHAQEIGHLTNVKAQISEVQVVILDNIKKVLERGEHLNSVEDKANELHELSVEYRETAREIKRKMWYQNMKIKLVILGILLLILALIIWTSICHGFNCSN
uniref:Longin domain-containing protein n=1 Tax=Opuntia streptacantha TaxID=393608 RepID=A0A7C9EF76_OPUST